MEKTNLNFSTVITNSDDKTNILVKNNFIDTNNYVRQNLFNKSENLQKSNTNENEQTNEYLSNQRSRSITKDNFKLDEYTRRKVIPISTSSNKFKVSRINVDSHYRIKNPKNILDSVQHFLPNNPLFFQANSNILTIYDPNHGYNYNDKITLINLNILSTSMKISFISNSYFVRVEYENHNLNQNINYIMLIENFIGNSNNNTIFDNIPINYLNKIHNIYFSNGSDTANNNYFYIKINILPILNNNQTIDVRLYSLNGVPTSNINSNYPININQSQSSLIIVNILSVDYYQVNINSVATIGLTDNSNLTLLKSNIGVGGSDIIISKIVDVIEGFPDSNHFKYNLGKNFNKIKKIRLLSTEIPNTEKTIKAYPLNKQNNLLYWQNVDDGDTQYYIQVTPGNYTIDELASEIQTQISLIPRANQLNTNSSKIIYMNNHFATVSITQSSNTFSISLYTTIILSDAIKISTYIFTDGFSRIVLNHPAHGLNIGDSISIQGAITTEGIPDSALNGTFTIESIMDVDNYQIKLNKYNPSTNTSSTGGGNAITILKPLYSRLLFNMNGTIGNILGFRNVGEYNAVTIYSKIITNITEYELDSNLNSLGISNSNIINNTLFNFNGDNYIYLTLNYIFKDSIDNKNIKNIFAKLLLSGTPNSVIYNDFIQLGEEFLDPIASVNYLEFFFYTADGLLYDFNNIDVSFTIELFEEISTG